jgi:dolichol-phosphate mannosyltransferase
MPDRTLVFIPTYNERENVGRMLSDITALGLNLDVLFMDDNSPDGTGQFLDQLASDNPHLKVIHRPGKLGVGSAHIDGIRYAYEQGYDRLVTMDCDFTHSPTDIPRMLGLAEGCDIAVASRWLRRDSLPGWNVLRRFLTALGHFLTKHVLSMPHDASGAFRVYNLRRIPREMFDVVTSRSYAFFFESLFVLMHAGHTVRELPIVLTARTYGHSKMSMRDAARSAEFLLKLWLESRINPGRFEPGRKVPLKAGLSDSQGWDAYWQKKQDTSGFVYELVAAIYRALFIRPNLQRALRRTFPRGTHLIHAGCGSGMVDQNLQDDYRITAVDVSPQALYLYSQNNPRAYQIEHASIFALPQADESVDGVYNLGVLEHFSHGEIVQMLREFRRVLRPGGMVLVFWPHTLASSVFVLRAVHFVMRHIFRSSKRLHPAEPSLLKSKREARAILEQAGFSLQSYCFGARDLFIQSIVVGTKALIREKRSSMSPQFESAESGIIPAPSPAVPSPEQVLQ